MSVEYSWEQEKREREENKELPKWEYFRGGIVQAVHKAKEMGWGQKKVQVRKEIIAKHMVDYVVEPYEEGCACRNLLDFEDFFMPETGSPREWKTEG